MKVLIVSRGVKPLSPDISGGAERVLFQHAQSLAKNRHEVHVVSDSEGELPSEPALTVHGIGMNRRFREYCRNTGFYLWILLHLTGNFFAFWSAFRIVRKSETPFDVIHCHGNLSALLLSFFVRSTPVIYSEHDSTPWACVYPSRAERIFRRTIYSILNANAFKRVTKTLVLYPEQKAEIIERWGVKEDKIAVIPNGVDERLFHPEESAIEGLADDYCLFVGRLEPRKGVDVLLKALKESTVSCLVIGEGPEQKKLETMSSELGLESRVKFLGPVQNGKLISYYSNASFFVAPSRSEAFPITVLEALACGRPVVATRVGALTSMIETHQCGYLCNPDEADDLADKIKSMSQANGSADNMGQNGRDLILKNFTWEIVAQKLEVIYSSFAVDKTSVSQADEAEAVAANSDKRV